MADEFGAIEFPVLQPTTKNGSVTDPTLDRLTAFLKAVLNAELGGAWDFSSPGKKFVEEAFPLNPEEGTFNERQLPSLFVWRGPSEDNRITDDWTEKFTDVQVLWVPQSAEQGKRVTRAQAINGFHNAISKALKRSRHRAWVDPGDDLEDAATRGSVLNARCKFFKWPMLKSTRPHTLTIQKDLDAKGARYPGVLAVIRICEKTYDDPAERGSIAVLDSTVTQGGGAFSIAATLPKPTP